MAFRRMAVRGLLVAALALVVSVGPYVKEAQAYCLEDFGYYTQYYRLVICHGEGCQPAREVVGECTKECFGSVSCWGNTNCGSSLVRCETTSWQCDPICQE